MGCHTLCRSWRRPSACAGSLSDRSALSRSPLVLNGCLPSMSTLRIYDAPSSSCKRASATIKAHITLIAKSYEPLLCLYCTIAQQGESPLFGIATQARREGIRHACSSCLPHHTLLINLILHCQIDLQTGDALHIACHCRPKWHHNVVEKRAHF